MSIYVVGIGPGDKCMMTSMAISAIENAEVIVGYHTYIDLINDMTAGKEIIATAMKKETDRVCLAIKEAQKGKTVAVVSSGDAGVYGMAGLVYEMAQGLGLEIIVVPGITAATSAAAVMGAPLMNDFAVISLSDLLTPWEVIEKRLDSAAYGDFSIAIYNPSSIKRSDYLEKACKILLRHKDPKTPCGIARNIGRSSNSSSICTLEELASTQVDMFTTVIIGNTSTKIIDNKLVTTRGYTYE